MVSKAKATLPFLARSSQPPTSNPSPGSLQASPGTAGTPTRIPDASERQREPLAPEGSDVAARSGSSCILRTGPSDYLLTPMATPSPTSASPTFQMQPVKVCPQSNMLTVPPPVISGLNLKLSAALAGERSPSGGVEGLPTGDGSTRCRSDSSFGTTPTHSPLGKAWSPQAYTPSRTGNGQEVSSFHIDNCEEEDENEEDEEEQDVHGVPKADEYADISPMLAWRRASECSPKWGMQDMRLPPGLPPPSGTVGGATPTNQGPARLVLRPRGGPQVLSTTATTTTNTLANLTTSTHTPTPAPPGIFTKPAVTPVNLEKLLPAWPPEPPANAPPPSVATGPGAGGGVAGSQSEPGSRPSAVEDDTQLIAFESLLPERNEDLKASSDQTVHDKITDAFVEAFTESHRGRTSIEDEDGAVEPEWGDNRSPQQLPLSGEPVRFVLATIKKECAFLRLVGHGVHSVKLTKARQHPRVRAVLCMYVRGLPSRKRTKWLMPLAWCVAAVLQRGGCNAAVHGGYLYVAPPGQTGPALPVDFAMAGW